MIRKNIVSFLQNTKQLFLGAILGLLIGLIYCFFFYDIISVGSKETYYTIAAICSSITIIWTISIFTINESDKENNRRSDQFRKFYIDNFFIPNVINEFNILIDGCLYTSTDRFKNKKFQLSLNDYRNYLIKFRKKSSSVERISKDFKDDIDEILDTLEFKVESFFQQVETLNNEDKKLDTLFDQLEVDLYVCQNEFHYLVSKKIDYFFKCFNDK